MDTTLATTAEPSRRRPRRALLAVIGVGALSLTLATASAAGATTMHVGGSGAKAGATPNQRVIPSQSKPGGYSISGIDVSDNNDPVNWSSVSASSQFAYVKATEGTYYSNDNYSSDIAAARANGLATGAYGFPVPSDGNPVAQADFFASKINYHPDGQTLLPFVDLEYGSTVGVGDDCYYDSPSEMVGFLRSYLSELTTKFGRKPMIYTNADWWNECTGDSTGFGSYPLDVADWTNSPPVLPDGWTDYTFWQYSSVANIGGQSVDGDVFNGNASDLVQFESAQGATSPSLSVLASGKLAAAFRADGTGHLWNWSGSTGTSGAGSSSTYGIAPGTSPAVATLPNGKLAVAFHANDGNLWTWTGPAGGTGTAVGTPYGMAAGTSPSLGVLSNGHLAVAFNSSSTGVLYTWTGAPATTGTATMTSLGLAAGTSPSLAVLKNGNLAVAFNANSTGVLWTWTGAVGSSGHGTKIGLGLATATSPALTVAPNGTLAVAFDAASNGKLWTWTGALNSTGKGFASNYGVLAGTSPSITALASGDIAVAFNSQSTHHLWTWNGTAATAGRATDTGYGMELSTSPSLQVLSTGALAVAFDSYSSDNLWTWTGALNSAGTGTSTPFGIG